MTRVASDPRQVPEQSLVDMLRSQDRAQEKMAFEKVVVIIRRRCRGYPGFRRLTGAALDAQVENAAQAFLLDLLERPAKLAAASVNGWAVVVVEVRRFLVRWAGRGVSIEISYDKLRLHFYRKVRSTLRTAPTFRAVPIKRWALSDPDWPPAGARPLDTDSVRDRLPDLPSDLTAHRPDQLPPLVDRTFLAIHMETALTLFCRPESTSTLSDLSWTKLVPHPEGQIGGRPTTPRAPGTRQEDDGRQPEWWDLLPDSRKHGGSPEEEAAACEWEVMADREAETLIEKLPRRTIQAARIRFADPGNPLPLTEVASRLGVSKGTAENEVGESRGLFFLRLRERVSILDLDEEMARRFLEVVFERLPEIEVDDQEAP